MPIKAIPVPVASQGEPVDNTVATLATKQYVFIGSEARIGFRNPSGQRMERVFLNGDVVALTDEQFQEYTEGGIGLVVRE